MTREIEILREPVPPLFHYTCAHGETGILADGCEIKPGMDGLVWLTDLRIPNRAVLGLTRNYIRCDRTEFRFMVRDLADVLWWPDFRRAAPDDIWRDWSRYLESAPGVRPAHWYISQHPVKGEPL